jgi:hypothetical protein
MSPDRHARTMLPIGFLHVFGIVAATDVVTGTKEFVMS